MIKKEIFLDNLPRCQKGDGAKLGSINWKKSIGHNVKGVYDGIKFEVEIIDYESDEQALYIKYEDNDVFKILTGSFQNCYVGKMLGYRNNKFRAEIGEVLKDNNRDLIIIDRIYNKNKNNRKYYQYKCNKCGYIGWLEENNLLNHNNNCSCCSNRVAVLGINTIWDTDRWMCDLGVSEEDAKKYTHGSHKKITVICPDCKNEKCATISDINTYKSIGCSCGDSVSYPEKFMYNMLKQLGVVFSIQLSKKIFSWCNKYKYDFYLSDLNCIIETHGEQHYKEKEFGRSFCKEQENDIAKEKLAKINGVDHYVVIDCQKSELEWIRNSIKNSKLNEIFNLSNIDWLKCESYALSNRVKEACELRNTYPDINTDGIGKIMNIDRHTICRYLKKGKQLGWCDYNAKDEKRKSAIKSAKSKCKQVEVFKNGVSLGIFESASELCRISKDLFGVCLGFSNIAAVCNGKRKTHNGFMFRYITKQ